MQDIRGRILTEYQSYIVRKMKKGYTLTSYGNIVWLEKDGESERVEGRGMRAMLEKGYLIHVGTNAKSEEEMYVLSEQFNVK